MTGSSSPWRLLLVEHDADVRDLLTTFLAREGFAVSLATAPPEALALVDEHPFHLILTDLFKTRATEPFSSIDSLRDEAYPTPVMVVTGWNIEEAEIKQRGFSGLIRKPFDLEEVLTSIATCLPTLFSPEQAHQAQVVQAYFAALNARDFAALAALCAPDVTHTLPADLLLAGIISGKAAFLTYAEAALARVPGIQYEEVLVSPDPHGFVARACSVWRGQAFTLQRQTSTLRFRFQGECISQISVQPGSGERFTRLMAQATRPMPQASAIPPQAARVLLVEADALLRASLAQTLTQAGYQVSSVSSLAEGLALLKERCFHLILADLFAGASLHGLAEAHLLWQNARPTPVGLITNHPTDLGEATRGDFSFLVPTHVDQDHLLWLMAALLHQPLSRTQERQTDLVRRLFATINAEEWEQLTTLCTEDLRFYPPPGSSFHHVKVLHGVQAYQAQLEAVDAASQATGSKRSGAMRIPKGWRSATRRTGSSLMAERRRIQGPPCLASRANGLPRLPRGRIR